MKTVIVAFMLLFNYLDTLPNLKELMIQSILFVFSVLQVIYFGSLSRTVSEAYYNCVFVDVHVKYISYCLQFERAVERERRGSR